MIDFYDKNEKFREPLLVWIRPSLDSLQFIEKCLINNLGIEKVITLHFFDELDCGFSNFGKKFKMHSLKQLLY